MQRLTGRTNLFPTWLCLVVLLASAPARSAGAAEPASSTSWRSGPSLRRYLQLPAGVSWQQVPLREALVSLSRDHRVAIMLDRRVDPDQEITFAAAGVTLDELLHQLADKLQLGFCPIDSVVYFGPKQITIKLPTLAAAARQWLERLPPDRRHQLLERKSLGWPQLSEPRQLVAQVASAASLEVDNLQQIPHDLWPAVDLPPLPVTDRLTLLLAGFQLTFQISADGRRATLVPIDEEARVQLSYHPTGAVRQHAATLARRFPAARIEPRGNKLIVTASYADHDAIRRALMPPPTRVPKPTGTRVVHTLHVESKPVGAVVAAIARQLGLELTVAAEARLQMDRLVSVDVKGASTDELLRAVLAPAGLTFRLDGKHLTVEPSPR